MSIYRIIWWVAAAILTASGGIVAAATVPTDILVSAVIAAVLIGGGSPWLRPITLRTTPPPRTLLTIALRDGATWAAVVITVIGLIALSGAAALPLILLMTLTSAPMCRYIGGRVEFTQALPCSPKSPLIRTSTVDVPLLPLPDCSQLSDEALCRCLAHELARSAERPLAIAVDDGRAAPRAYPRALPRRNRTSAILEDSPDGSAAVLVPVVTPRSSSPHEIIPSPRHRNPDGKPCTIPKPPTDPARTSITAESVPHKHIYGPTVENPLRNLVTAESRTT